MPSPDRRVLLRGLFSAASFSIAGCLSGSEEGTPEDSATTEATATTGRSTTEGDEQAISTPVESNIETECITSEFSGYVGTTPVPAPGKPAELNPKSVIDYAIAYERYYERYLALYEIGSPTPEEEGYPAHGFPEVSLANLEREVLMETNGRYVVRLAFSRVFEGSNRGEYTVTYYVSDEYTIRAETAGIESPGPDPLTEGKIMSC